MADPTYLSLLQQKFLTGDKPLLTLDADFLTNHTKVSLRSDESDRIWKVKLDGGRLADGWEKFAGEHKFRDGDGLVFKHCGEEIFHVSVASRSVSSDIHHASSSYVDTEDTYIDDDYVDTDDDDLGDISMKKPETDSSSSHSCFITACVTRYSLLNDRLDLSRNFTVSFDEHKKRCEIDLVNGQGRRWTLLLAKNSSSSVFYIRRGWENFCSTNELRQGDVCKFKIVENGERPVLWLCPQESVNGHKEKSTLKGKMKKKKTPSPILIRKYTPSRDSTGQLSLPVSFTRENGITKAGEVILVNKDGRKWLSYLQITGLRRGGSEWFYLRKGWREMCEANGVKVNDSFGLELIWEGANPMFKFCSKIENHENMGNGNRGSRKKRACETAPQPRSVKKTLRVEIEGRVSKGVGHRPEHQVDEKRGRSQVLKQTNTNSRKLQRLQPRSCSVSDQVANVKQGIVDTLITVRQCRTELETSEQNLEASLQAIEVLGERILGISKILNNSLI